MDWFEKLTGFKETGYDDTRAKLKVDGDRIFSTVNGASYRTGTLELASLESLRARGKECASKGRLKVSQIVGDVRQLHRDSKNATALFQVASQFNLLEMTGPSVSPEDGVTRYQSDPTQGPACAIAAGAATIYRNYFVPVGKNFGQRTGCQIDALTDFSSHLGAGMGVSPYDLWTMKNGYALPSESGLKAIAGYLCTLNEADRDSLRMNLRIGLHWDVEATESSAPAPLLSQAFCSSMPVAYSHINSLHWHPLGQLVLEAAYEATLWAGAINRHRNGCKVVYLTLLGGGAFGNPSDWIHAAIRRAIELVQDLDLDLRLVSYRRASTELEDLVKNLA